MEQKLKVFNEYLYENEVRWADVVYLTQPINGVRHEITWKEAMFQARKITAFLKSLGLKKGDKVGILSKNCAEWFIADFAIAMAGFVSVPLYAAQLADTVHYILDHAEVKALFVGKLDKWKDQEKGIAENIIRIAFPYEDSMPAKYHWNDLLDQFEPDMTNYVPDESDLYTIMYTSGTTGAPKGVMITFGATGHAMEATSKDATINRLEHHHFLSYLPLGHIFERIVVEHTSLFKKTTIYFVEALSTFTRDLQYASPTLFVAAPRIWAQFQKGILAKLSQKKLEILLKIPILNYFIKKKIKHGLGFDRTYWCISGSAPMSVPVMEWYQKLGITICEGYGRTEDLAYATWQYPEEVIFGTVGKPRPGIEVKLGEDDELLTRSKMMMSGYYKEPGASKEIFTKDGFIHTGDQAIIHKNGYITILGRVNDTFKTDKGEFVNPLKLEDKFAENHDIEQLCAIGLTLPQPVLLVVLSHPALAMHSRQELIAGLKQTMHSINPGLTNFEKVKRIIVCKDPWTTENDLLTPTFKLKRKAIYNRYIDLAKKVSEIDTEVYWEA